VHFTNAFAPLPKKTISRDLLHVGIGSVQGVGDGDGSLVNSEGEMSHRWATVVACDYHRRARRENVTSRRITWPFSLSLLLTTLSLED